MPRTIESIMDCHHLATQRRQQGEPVWDHTIQIKQFLTDSNDGLTNQVIRDAATSILNALRITFKDRLDSKGIDESNSKFDMHLSDIVEGFQEIVDLTGKRGLDKEDPESLEAFNDSMGELYDWADYARVWIG